MLNKFNSNFNSLYKVISQSNNEVESRRLDIKNVSIFIVYRVKLFYGLEYKGYKAVKIDADKAKKVLSNNCLTERKFTDCLRITH